MQRKTHFGRVFLLAAICAVWSTGALATIYGGTLYYTTFAGGQNVWKVSYSYDDALTAFALGNPTNIASNPGADGIIFAPNGNLLIGGAGTGRVYELNPSNGSIVNSQATGTSSYHISLDPNGNKVYSSDFGGRLNTVALPIGSGSSFTNISGSDTGLTQVAFGNEGQAFYVNGSPNGGGNLGTINIATGVTTRLYSSVAPAHGLVYDSYTDLITFFGAGRTGTINDVTGGNLLTSGAIYGVGDFDQGTVDGLGHAFVAGSNSITLIDYRLSGDITRPNFTTFRGGFANIDDVAPLTGLGAPNATPEPATLVLLGIGLAGFAAARRRKLFR